MKKLSFISAKEQQQREYWVSANMGESISRPSSASVRPCYPSWPAELIFYSGCAVLLTHKTGMTRI